MTRLSFELLIKPATAAQRSVPSQKPSYHFLKTHASARCDLTRATRKKQTLRCLAKKKNMPRRKTRTPLDDYKDGLRSLWESAEKSFGTRAEKLRLCDATIDFYHECMQKAYDVEADREEEEVEEEASAEDVPQMTEAERKHRAAATQIALLHGKQRTLLSKKLYAYVTDIEDAKNQIETTKKNTELNDNSKQAVIGVNKTRIQECNVNIEALRNEYCYFERLIVLQEKDLDVTSNEVPQDCLDATPIDFKTGNPLEMSQAEQAFKIESYIKDWTDYYKDEFTKQNEDGDDVGETPAKRAKRKPENVTKGPKRGKKGKGMFEKDERVEVESSDFNKPIKWWKGTIVTTSCPPKISHYKVLYDEPKDDREEDRLEEVPVRRISKWGEAGKQRRDEYVRKF